MMDSRTFLGNFNFYQNPTHHILSADAANSCTYKARPSWPTKFNHTETALDADPSATSLAQTTEMADEENKVLSLSVQ